MSEETKQTVGLEHVEAREACGLLFCSGQIGLTATGELPEAPTEQFALAFSALASVLDGHGCGMEDVVDLTTFHVGYPADMADFMAAKAAAMPRTRAAWTAIGVAALGYPGSLVEIKAIARLPAGGA